MYTCDIMCGGTYNSCIPTDDLGIDNRNCVTI